MGSAASVVRSRVTSLRGCAVAFLPADPPLKSAVAFWHPDGSAPDGSEPRDLAELTVALPEADGTLAFRSVPALLLSAAEALPVLTRARAGAAAHREGDDPARSSAAFWGAAALLALQLAARGRSLPDGDAQAHVARTIGPPDAPRLRELAATMPSCARAAPCPPAGAPSLLPEPLPLLRAFLDAVGEGLGRPPAAAPAARGPLPSARAAQRARERGVRATGAAARHTPGIRLSLRVEAPTADDGEEGGARCRAVLQVHGDEGPAVVADAADVWAGRHAALGLGPRARTDLRPALRAAVAAWEPLAPLLHSAVPDAVELTDEDVTGLLSPTVGRSLAAAGVDVHWPRDLVRPVTARGVIEPRETSAASGPGGPLLSSGSWYAFRWRVAVGDQELTRAELDALAESRRPLVRLRDRWVVLDLDEIRRRAGHRGRAMGAAEALGSVLAGSVEESGERVEVGAGGALENLRARLSAPEHVPSHAAEPPQPPGLAATLRDHQLLGFRWLHRMTALGLGVCLADDMGLGKTVTLIALHLHRHTLPGTVGATLVVCPASVLGTWEREIGRFAPHVPVRRHHGRERNLDGVRDGEFVLTTYGTMRRDVARLTAAGPWSLVVADEAQHVKNPFSLTARALRAVPSAARVALTGTPVENNLSELWAILDWTTPGLLGPLPAFRLRYADAVEGRRDPAAGAALARVVRPFLLRRRKSDPGIAPELPPRTETDHAVPLTAEQAGLYEAAVREGLASVSGTRGMARRGLVVKLLTSLKQICNHPAQYLKEEPGRTTDGRGRLRGRSGKLEFFDELLDTVVAEGAATLVFTQYVRMARLLRDHLTSRGVPVLLLHGGTPVARREEMVRRFQDGEVPVFLLSLKAAGTGLNLTRAEHVVHFDRWWNPAVETQATDRAYRIGQMRPVQVHRLVTEGTVEDRVAELLERKRSLADAVLGDGEGALTELSDTELAGLVGLR
ncbi:DEAD/DEAH box helicase, partial [Streptomyces chumphonensis]|uniref:DEAD/DEAH box helicase n=1 Tax=Streptomyces chumphonensis TaxID=1214925 RepID=UPI003D70902C